ncbi:hypothetical protein GCM10009836_07000 [Pseudonocardia ailaonensis]|uniref:Glycosyltransferase RgtA/B/C/D-like domain-containing protein n=1 Tax=Pseudonocardia ailaonensis TaxID=367279 RepID=A0ABN2MM84_9PSEU
MTPTCLGTGRHREVEVPPPPRGVSLLPRGRRDLLGWLTCVLLLAAVVLSVVRAFGPMTYEGDIWRQSDTATIAHNFFRNGMELLYPQINWGGSGPGYVETEFQLVPYLAASLYHVFGEHAAIGRLVSLVFMIVGAAAFWGFARRVLPETVARWSMIAFALSPAFMRYGSAFMPDAAALAFYLLAVLAYQRWLTEDRRRWLVGTAAAVAMAALVKPTSLHILLVLLIWTAIVARRRLLRPGLYAAAVASLVPAAIWMWHARGLYEEYGNTFGVLSGGDSKVGGLQYWLSSGFYLGNLTIEATIVYGLAGVPLAILALVVARRSVPAYVWAALPSLVVFYFAVPRYSMALGPHYHLFSLPSAAILVGLGVTTAYGRLRALRPRRTVAALTAVGTVVAVAALGAPSISVLRASMVDTSGTYRSCATALDQVARPGDLSIVATDSLAVEDGSPNNFQDPAIFYLADRRGWVLAADQQEPSRVRSYITQGAQYLVSPDPSIVTPSGTLGHWLDEHATRVRSASANGCDVWRLYQA